MIKGGLYRDAGQENENYVLWYASSVGYFLCSIQDKEYSFGFSTSDADMICNPCCF